MGQDDIDYKAVKAICHLTDDYKQFKTVLQREVHKYCQKPLSEPHQYNDVKRNYLGCIKLLKKFERLHSLQEKDQTEMLSWLCDSLPFKSFAEDLQHELDRSYPQYVDLQTCKIIGHRCFDPYITNLQQGFTLRTRVDYAEVDVCRIRSGEIVLQHDRFTPSGDVLEESCLGDLVKPVLLEDLCEIIQSNLESARSSYKLMIDIKGSHPDTVDGIMQVLRNRKVTESSVLLASFSTVHLQKAAQSYPNVKRALITANVTADNWLPLLTTYGIDLIIIDENIACSALVDFYRKHCVEVWIYTVNERGRLWSLVNMGVTGIITDIPNVLQHNYD